MKWSVFGNLTVVLLAGSCVAGAQSQTSFNPSQQPPLILVNANEDTAAGTRRAEPELAVSRRILDFGSVPVGHMKTLSFTVQNVGGGLLTGAANVSEPFNIVADNPYAVKYRQTRLITVQYVPASVGVHMSVIHLTGGGGAAVTVMGSATPRRAPARLRAPSAPQNLRLLAGN